MSADERRKYVESTAEERSNLKKKILALSHDREAYVTAKLKESGQADTLGSAVVETVREQAGARAFHFGN